jgi:hypothetical protein
MWEMDVIDRPPTGLPVDGVVQVQLADGTVQQCPPQGNRMPHLKQPVLGIVATFLVMVISLGFISLFDWATFGGWVSYSLMCTVPTTIVIGVIWTSEYPAFAAARQQPLRGWLFLLVVAAVGLVVGAVHLFTVGGGVSPPSPMLVQCVIVSVVVTFWMSVMWGGWPFMLIRNRLVAGFSLVIGCYVMNYVLFRIFFDYGFLRGSPLYHTELDPKGMFDAWSATVFYVTCLGIMFLLLHFDLWPLTRSSTLMKQPVLGLVWTVIALILGAVIFTVGTHALGMESPIFLVRVPIPFIFGTIVVLNMLGGSLFARYSQPIKGVCSALAAAVIGTVLALIYRALASSVTGTVLSGPPAYDLEVWVASALLAVTFPFLTFYANFFQMWPLIQRPRCRERVTGCQVSRPN